MGRFSIEVSVLNGMTSAFKKPLDWSPSFHENSLEICLNFSGTASLVLRKSSDSLQATQLAIYTTTQDVLSAAREKETAHRFLTFEFSRDYLRKQFCGDHE